MGRALERERKRGERGRGRKGKEGEGRDWRAEIGVKEWASHFADRSPPLIDAWQDT